MTQPPVVTEWHSQVITKEDIRSEGPLGRLPAGSGAQEWSRNNTALKTLRDTNEQPEGVPTRWGVDLTNADPIFIQTCLRTTGVEYKLGEPKQPWSWRAMLHGMSEDTFDRIVGPGITTICCMPITSSYDHKRCHAAKKSGHPYPKSAPVPIWDFVVRRADGTGVRFHPCQTTREIHIMDLNEGVNQTAPTSGRGGTDGPGTYRRMRDLTYNEHGTIRYLQTEAAPKGAASSGSAVAGSASSGLLLLMKASSAVAGGASNNEPPPATDIPRKAPPPPPPLGTDMPPMPTRPPPRKAQPPLLPPTRATAAARCPLPNTMTMLDDMD